MKDLIATFYLQPGRDTVPGHASRAECELERALATRGTPHTGGT